MDIKIYLKDTEPAVKLLFKGMSKYDAIKIPSILDYRDTSGLIMMSEIEHKRFMKTVQKSLDLMFSRATLCGSILQIAYTALDKFSTNSNLPENRDTFGLEPNDPRIKFFVGREVHNIPIGLLIYAGRVQYNHWDDGEDLRKPTKNIFDCLKSIYYDNPMVDMTYELDYPEPGPVSHYIVRQELKWMDYIDYLRDLKSMLFSQ